MRSEGALVADPDKKRKIKQGRVVSDRMDKTVVVAVQSYRSHPLYGKKVKRIKRFKAHDDNNSCRTGDIVRIIEDRPLSKEKRWRVAEIVAKGEVE